MSLLIENHIYNTDAMNILRGLPNDYFDLTLTDPPYGLNKLSAKGEIAAKRSKNEYDSFEDTPEYFQEIVVPIIVESIRVSKRTIVTPGNKNFCYLPQPDDFGVFYQPATPGISSWGRPDAQPIFYYGKTGVLRNITQFNSRQVNDPPSCSKDLHPCSKPLKPWIWLLLKGSNENDLIFDPFIGSGTTAIACIKANRKYIGCEISPNYCKVAEKRIQETKAQYHLF
jgi:site-specific DNA-methyltransferase (adenine-specific)